MGDFVGKSSPWTSMPSTHSKEQVKSLSEIMKEQANGIDFPLESYRKEQTAVAESDGKVDEDLALAMALQQIEDEELASGMDNRSTLLQEQNRFEKVSVVSRYDSGTTFGNRTFPRIAAASSEYNEARNIESQLNDLGVRREGASTMFKGGVTVLPDGRFMSKHDPLLNGLVNSEKLSELEGVGDLQGAGILVGNSVANSIRSAQKKRNK